MMFKRLQQTTTLPTESTLRHALTTPDYHHRLNDHSNVHGFRHPWPIVRPSVNVLQWFLHRHPARWPRWEHNQPHPSLSPTTYLADWQTCFIGHATVLIRIGQHHFLTDPVWSMRASPLPFAGPRRVREAGLALADLPKIDGVLLSHNHYDHMDLAALRWLHQRDQMPIYTGLANAHYLPKDMNVVELDWWQDATSLAHPQIKVVYTPAQHFSGRGLRDRNLALWGGVSLITPHGHLFFAGDTGYGPHFHQIRERLGAPRLALLPIGAYEPRAVMKAMHMNPAEAVQAYVDLQAHQGYAIHHRTFQLTDEAINQPLLDLAQALTQHQLCADSFLTPVEGQWLRHHTDLHVKSLL